jgi:trans-L-3-hydroxyproline dehydratase
VRAGETRRFRSVTGGIFTGRVIGPATGAPGAVTVEVGGQAHWMGRGEFMIDEADPLGHGFELPRLAW